MRRNTSFCVAVVLTTVVVGAASIPASWTVETAVTGGTVGLSSALAFDSAGQPAIAYSDSTGKERRLAYRAGSTWATELIDRNGGGSVAIATEPGTGILTAAYVADLGGKAGLTLRLARRLGASWATTNLDGAADYEVSLAFDQAGYPAVSYSGVKGKTRVLKVARQSSSGWSLQTIATSTETGSFSYQSLAIDSTTGELAVAFLTTVTTSRTTRYHEITLARSTSTGWVFEVIDTQIPMQEGNFMSLAFDPLTSNPVIAYRARGQVYFSERAGAGWTSTSLAQGSGHGVSMTYRADGQLNVAYGLNNLLEFAQRSGATWTFETVEELVPAAFASRPSLRLSPGGVAAVSYGVWSAGSDLRFATASAVRPTN